MAIAVVCPQGHRLSAREGLAGKRLKCPKCGSEVTVPESNSPTPRQGEVADAPPHQPAPQASSQAAGESSGGDGYALANDGAGDSQGDTPSPQTTGGETSQEAPTLEERKQGKSSQGAQSLPSELSMASKVATVGAGAVLGLLLTGLAAWGIFGGGEKEPPAVAAKDVPPNEIAPVPSSEPMPQPEEETPNTSEMPEPGTPDPPSEATPPEAPQAQPIPTEPSVPARDLQPFDLAPFDLDKRLSGFTLPDATWAAAYDEITGRLAITNDEKGVLIYDLDSLLAGDPAPEAAVPTNGLPTAVCLKPYLDRRAFVIAGQEEASLLLLDAESLQPIGKILLNDLAYVDFLAGSSSPDDPFVYYSTQRFNWVDSSMTKEEIQETADRIGRVNLVTGRQDAHTESRFIDLTVSPDGSRLYVRPHGSTEGLSGAWKDLLSYSGREDRSKFRTWARSYAVSPMHCLGDYVSVNAWLYNESMSVFAAILDYSPAAAFRHRPVWVGLHECEIVFGSANHYRRLASIPLPGGWRKPDRARNPVDLRFRENLSRDLKSPFLDTRADSTRNMAILTFSDHLLLAPLDRMDLPTEPSLQVRRSLPDTVAPDELLQLDLELEAEVEDVVIEFVPNTDWLPKEQQRLLGVGPFPKPLELRRVLNASDSEVSLRSHQALANVQTPFRLRIGNEIMTVTGATSSTLTVERTHPVTHTDSCRVAVVDEAGLEVTRPTAPPKPQGKRLSLAAMVNNQQNLVLVNDIRPLSGEELPFEIQVGDEKMLVTAVDDFRQSLTVKRSEPVQHSVSSDVFVLSKADTGDDSSSALPKVEGRRFSWTPSSEQVGKQTIRMRARTDKVSREWFWDVTVGSTDAKLPFQVVGIEAQPGTSQAVLWGQAELRLPTFARPAQRQPNTHFVGIYDLEEKRVLRHAEVSKPIVTAALDRTGAYALLDSSPPQVVRFDLQTLEVADQVTIPKQSNKLLLIAGRYLAVTGSETYRFNIPDLSPVEPELKQLPYPIAGRVRDGWVWDGVVWDEELREPRLFLFPVHFIQRINPHAKPQMIAAGGAIHMRTLGCYTCTWSPPNVKLEGTYNLTSRPAGLSSTNGSLLGYSWATLSRPRVGSAPKPNSVKLVDLSTVERPRDNRLSAAYTRGYVSEADGQVHVAVLGKLYSVPLDRVVTQEESFRFVEKQDRFVLEAGKPAKIQYSAPGAEKYHFQLWFQRPTFHDDPPAMTAESSDGSFELPLDNLDKLAGHALETVRTGITSPISDTDLDRAKEYIRQITPAYERLTGRKPRGVPYPVYVTVVAEHEDGQQKAGLAHSYLIEVTVRQLQQQLRRLEASRRPR